MEARPSIALRLSGALSRTSRYSAMASCPCRMFSSDGAPGMYQIRVELLGLFEIFDRGIKLRILESGDALVEEVACAKLGTPRDTGHDNQQRRQGEHLAG